MAYIENLALSRLARQCGLVISMAALTGALAAPVAYGGTTQPDTTLQVLHWWTSASERKAATLLAARLADEGVVWRDAGIPGGAGIGAGKVLKSRVLANDAPEVTQIIGVSIKEWADLGFLLELDKVASTNKWNTVFFPTIQNLIQHRKHVVAAPLGIHRTNTLFYNRKIFTSLKLSPPESWDELVVVAARLKAAGVIPLAQSSEPWQVATLFENLILAESGPDYHRELFVKQNAQAVSDKRFVQALERLRQMKGWMNNPVDERVWPEVVRQFARNEAAMMITGDWVKGELNEGGFATDEAFSCTAMPGTARYHLYSVDTFSMFTNDYSRVAAQEKLARLVATPAVQAEYNAVKGSVSVRRDADPAKMDSCARASWTTFAQGAAVQAPSLVHRMATDETSKDAIIAVIHRYFIDGNVSIAETQAKLAAMYRAFSSNRKTNQ
ncbi:ABC transporter substrate-binding protein [Undibacterium sp. TS12]|uniref:ABC transporter substrate-binding protein n=1 Tax=Undibacterium sp. TS12 TaxID=2908202 RepID=UPI001F4D3002|nr:ABC transporter substrate-binding protein [Undibacterium sp. TS12]MCH8618194.1 ABC transporter substrate-binding protein [Undibacterium sp. TS12]